MRFRFIVTLAVLLLPVGAAAKSVETTSGIIYNRNGQFEKARVILLKALAKDPKDAEAHFQIGFSYSKLDSVGLAYEHFVKARELEPKRANDVADNIQSNYARHYKAGQVAFSGNDFAKAATEFDLASQSDPTQASSHFNAGVAYSRLATTDSTKDGKALAEADRALELSKTDDANYPGVLRLVGRELVQLGREDEAQARFQPLLDQNPASYPVMQDIGTELLGAKQWKGAAIFLKMTADARAKAGAEDFDVYYNTGAALYNLGHQVGQSAADTAQANARYDEAIGYYQKALVVRPDEPSTVFNLVVANVAKRDWAGAAQWGEKYASLKPTDPKAWQLLARIYTELGEKDKALDAMSRFEELRKGAAQ